MSTYALILVYAILLQRYPVYVWMESLYNYHLLFDSPAV